MYITQARAVRAQSRMGLYMEANAPCAWCFEGSYEARGLWGDRMYINHKKPSPQASVRRTTDGRAIVSRRGVTSLHHPLNGKRIRVPIL
jgi:hypothetical protein